MTVGHFRLPVRRSGTHEIQCVVLTALNGFLRHSHLVFISTLEVFFNTMHFVNLRFTYLLTNMQLHQKAKNWLINIIHEPGKVSK